MQWAKQHAGCAFGLYLLPLAAHAQCIPGWHPRGPGVWPDHEVFALTTWDPDGPGPMQPLVMAAGNLSAPSLHVGLWDGESWTGMDKGTWGTPTCATLYDTDGTGPLPEMPVIGGSITSAGGTPVNRIARWDGAAWQPLGLGMQSDVDCLAVYQGDLLAGGIFQTAGGLPSSGLARWDGAAWHDFSQVVQSPDSLLVDGDDLYASANSPASMGGQPSIMRLRSGQWQVIGTQPNQPSHAWAMTMFRGDLIVGGQSVALGQYLFIARFDGTSWHDMGGGMNSEVRSLTVWDPDGPGPLPDRLIAGGFFSTAGGVEVYGVASWDGQQWSALGLGLTGPARALTVWNDQLIVGGTFGFAGTQFSPYFAQYGCGVPCEPDCNGDGLLNLSDFGCFQTTFASGHPQADCNRDSNLNLADFGCFQTKFALGCP